MFYREDHIGTTNALLLSGKLRGKLAFLNGKVTDEAVVHPGVPFWSLGGGAVSSFPGLPAALSEYTCSTGRRRPPKPSSSPLILRAGGASDASGRARGHHFPPRIPQDSFYANTRVRSCQDSFGTRVRSRDGRFLYDTSIRPFLCIAGDGRASVPMVPSLQ